MMISYRTTEMIISKTQKILKNRTDKQNFKKEVQKNKALSGCSTDNISNSSFKSNTSKDTGVHTQGSKKSMYSGDSYYTSSSVSSESRFSDDASTISNNSYSSVGSKSDISEYIENLNRGKNPKATTGKKDIISVASSTNDIQTVIDTSQQPKSINNNSENGHLIVDNLINLLQSVGSGTKNKDETKSDIEIILDDNTSVISDMTPFVKSCISENKIKKDAESKKSNHSVHSELPKNLEFTRQNSQNYNFDVSKDTNSNNSNNVNLKNIPKNLKGRTAQLGRFLQKNVLSSPLKNVTPIQSMKKTLNSIQEIRVNHQQKHAEKQEKKLFDKYFDGQRTKLTNKQNEIGTNIEQIKATRATRLNNLNNDDTNNKVVQLGRFIEKTVLSSPLKNVTPIQSMKKKLNSFQQTMVNRQEVHAKEQKQKLSDKYFDKQRTSLTDKQTEIKTNTKKIKETRVTRLKNLKKSDYTIGGKDIGNKLREFQLNDTDRLTVIKDYIKDTETIDHTAFETGALKKLLTVFDDDQENKNKISTALNKKIEENETLNDFQRDTKKRKLQREFGLN